MDLIVCGLETGPARLRIAIGRAKKRGEEEARRGEKIESEGLDFILDARACVCVCMCIRAPKKRASELRVFCAAVRQREKEWRRDLKGKGREMESWGLQNKKERTARRGTARGTTRSLPPRAPEDCSASFDCRLFYLDLAAPSSRTLHPPLPFSPSSPRPRRATRSRDVCIPLFFSQLLCASR